MKQETMGKFIAELRRASGMTQKELAEKLNVSDKAVSRWERDESAPDLSLIPTLADLLGVTCDELLRTKRRQLENHISGSAEQNVPGTAEQETALPEERQEKERLHAAGAEPTAQEPGAAEPAILEAAVPLPEQTIPEERGTEAASAEQAAEKQLRRTLSRYRSRTCIAVGLSVTGLLAALIADLGFLRAVIGFFAGAVFFVAAAVCQLVFLNRALLTGEDVGAERAALFAFRRDVIRLAKIALGVTAALLGFTFPLAPVDAYAGLPMRELLPWGGLCAAGMLLLYAVALYFLNASILKKSVYVLPEKEAERYHRNHRLKRRCALLLLGTYLVTFGIHQAMTTLWGPGSVMKGTVFYDYDSFVAYMEQEIPRRYSGLRDGDAAAPQTATEQLGETVYYDEFGREITEEEALRRTLKDAQGHVMCEYTVRNENVCRISYSPGKGTVLPITVSTYDQLQQAQEIVAQRHAIFAAVYMAEAVAVILLYFVKRAR